MPENEQKATRLKILPLDEAGIDTQAFGGLGDIPYHWALVPAR
jgi:hypothetical protein